MDKRLATRMLAGDPDAADILIRRHYAGVHRFLRHLTCNPDDASDLTQQTFAKLRSSLTTYRSEGSFRGWLFRVAYREFLHWHRSGHEDLPLAEGYPGRTALPEDSITLLHAIEGLSDELKHTFWLREVEGLSVREVAEALEVPEGTVKSRCHLAKERLRLKLGSAWSVPTDPLEADHVI